MTFLFSVFSLIWTQNFFAQSSNPSVNIGSNQIICAGSNTATVTASLSNLGSLTVLSYSWTVEGVSVGTSSSTSISVNASLSPNNPQEVICIATLSNASVLSDTVLVYTINPGVIAGDQFSCTSPFNPVALTSTNGGTTSLSNVNNFNSTYQWESAPTANGPWTAINGATNATYNSSNLTSTTYFRRVLEVTIGTNNPVSQSCVSNTVVVQLLTAPTITNNQCIAVGATANMAVSFNPALPSGFTATYAWTGPTGTLSSTSASASVTSFSASKAGTYTANISVSNGSTTCPYSLSTQLNLIPNTPTFTLPTSGCPGSSFQPIGFTPQTTPSTISYQWSISPSNGASTGLNSTSPTFLFNSGGTYTISVTATNSSGGCSATSTAGTIALPTFSISKPTIRTNNQNYNTSTSNPNTIAICSGISTSNALVVNNGPMSNPAGTTYTYSFNSGPATSILVGSPLPATNATNGAPIALNYGNNQLIMTANYNGCSQSVTINVYAGSNPYVSLGTSNSIGLCLGDSLSFTIDPIAPPTASQPNGQPNPPGTTYTLTYSDVTGSTVIPVILNDTTVIHAYNSTSCGASYPSNIYPLNTFYAKVTAQNFCGQTSSTVSPITVNQTPTANFTVTDSTICAGQNITVFNTGLSGNVIGSSPPYDCTVEGKFYWTITGGTLGTNFNVVSGTLGAYNPNYIDANGLPDYTDNGSSTLNINFITSGYYTITQYYYNSCGVKSKVRHICVINPPTCQFTVNPTNGCSPLTVNTNNTSTAPSCNGSPVQLSYVWTITNPTTNTSSVITSASLANPVLTLTNTTNANQTFNVNLSVIPMEPAASNIPFSNSTIFCPTAIAGTPIVGSIAVQSNGSWNGTITGLSGTTGIPAGTIITATNGTGSIGFGGTATVISSTLNSINFNSVGGSAPVAGGVSNLQRAAWGTVGAITGPNANGVWSASITGLCTTAGITVGSVIYAANGTGSVGSGGIYTVTAVTATSITYTATGGTTPVAGTVTNLALTSCVSTCSQQVIVNPEVNFTNLPTSTLCSGGTLGLNLTTNVPATFTWVATPNPNVTGESTTTQTGATINDQLVNLTNTVQTVTYTAVATSTAAFGSCTKTQTLTITVNPNISLTDPQDLTVCPGVLQPAIVFTSSPATGITYNWTNNNTAIDLAASGSGTIAAFSPTNNTNANITATITVTPLFGSCAGPAQTFTITVKPMPTVTGGGNQTICLGGSFNAITFASPTNVSGSTFNWTNSNTAIGIPNSGSGNISAFAPTSAVSASISVTPAANGCNGAVTVFTLIANPIPVINAIGNQTLCAGASTTTVTFGSNAPSTTYAWTNSNTAIGSLAASGTSASIPSFVTTNSTNAPITSTITVTPTANGCPGVPTSFTITVNPKPTVNAVNPIIVCNGAATGAIIFASTLGVPNTVFNWTNNNTSIGLAASGSGDIASFIGVNNGSANAISTITITPAAGGCNGNTSTFTITVKPTPVATAPANQSICAGSNSTLITFASNTTGATFAWTNDNTAIGLAASGSGPTIPAFATTNSGNSNITGLITVTPSANGCPGTPVTFSITVKPLPTVTPMSNQVFCNQESVASLVFTPLNGVSGTTFNWSRLATPTFGITAASGSGNLPAFTATNTGAAPIVNTITITPTANGCNGPTSTFTITVNPTPNMVAVSNQVRCTGTATNAITFATSPVVAGTQFNWTNSNTTIGLSAASGTGNISSFTTLNATNSAQVSTIVVTPSANGCAGPNASFTITVNPNPQVQNISNVTVCKQGVVAANVLSATVSPATFAWSINNSTIGLTPTSGTTGTIPSFTALNNGTAPVTATVTITPTINLNGQSCTGSTAGTYTITVNPTPVMSQFNPLLFVFCENATGTVPFNSNISANMSYSWTNDNTLIGLAASGTSVSPGAGISFLAVNNSNQPLTSNLMVTPSYTNGGVSCPGAAVPFAITVNPLPDVIPLPDYTICATSTGSNQFSSLYPIVGLGTTYAWTNSNLAIGMAASGNGSHFFTATNTSLVPITGTVTVTPTYTNNGVTCTGTPDQFVITVNPMPTVNPIANQGLCVGSTTTAVTPTGNIPGTLYTWTNNNTSTGLGSGATGTIPAFIGLNTTNAPNVSTVSVVPSYTYNNITCTGTAGQFGININPTPTVDVIADQQVCAQSNASVQFSSTPNIVGTVYNWTNNNTAIGLAASGTGALSFNATNTTSSPISATITVTPSFTNAGSTCWGPPQTFTIVVLPTPVMTNLANQTLCSGTATNALNFTSNLAGTQFAWTNSNTTIGLLGSGTGTTIATFTAVNSGTQPAQGLISVSPSLVTNNQTCIGSPVSATITVNPIPQMNPISNPSYCHGSAASIAFSSSINSGVSYAWTNSNTGIGLMAGNIGNIGFTAQNNTSAATSAQINVTPTYTNNSVQCVGLPATFTIQVAPNPIVNPVGNQVFCNNVLSSAIPLSSQISNTVFNWTNANTTIGLQATGTGNIPAFTTFNSSTTSVATSLVTVNPSLAYNGLTCTGPAITFPITINPTTTINAVPNVQLCNGETSIAINFSGTGTNYAWANSNNTIGIGLSGTGAIAPFSATNAGTTINSGTITATSQYIGGGITCNGNSTSFSIGVLPTPSVIDPPNVIVCNGAAAAAVNLSGVATNYTWTNSLPSIGLTNAGNTATIPSFNAINTSANPVLATVNITPTFVSGSKTCTGTAQSYTITVIPTPNFTSQPQSQTVCLGGALTNLSVGYSGGSGTPTYQWYSSLTNNNTTGTAIAGATGSTLTLPAATSVGTTYYYCQLTFPNSGTCAVIISNLAAITITNGPTIATPPLATQAVCEGGTIAPLTISINGGTGTPTYQWYTVNGSTYTPIAGATSINYTPPTFTLAGTYNYAVLVTQAANGCATTYSPNAQVIVVADPTVSAPTAATYCQNATGVTALSVTPTNGVIGSAYSYQWYTSTSSSNTTGIAVIPGATSSTYTPPVTAVGTSYYFCQVQQSPTTAGCLVSSATAAITVNLGPSFTTQPIANQTICVGGTVSALTVAYSGGFGAPTYQWFQNTTNSNTGGTSISGANSATFTVPSSATNTAGIYYYYCQISFNNNSGCSLISSAVGAINVLADPIISSQPTASQTICVGGSISPLSFVFSGGAPNSTPSYQWYSVAGASYTPITTNGTSATYAPPAGIYNTTGSYNYAVVLTQNVSGCASTYSATAQLNIIADPQITSPTSANYCQNAGNVVQLAVVGSNGVSSPYTYQWFVNSTNSNSGGSAIPLETNSTYTPPVSGTGTDYYYCVISQAPSNSGCSVASSPATIVVTPAPTITTQPLATQSVCVGGSLSALSVAYSGGSGTPSYQWFSNATNSYTGATLLTAATAASYTPPAASTPGTTFYFCQISFVSNSGCSQINSNISQITVVADPTITAQPTATQSICSGGTIPAPLSVSYGNGLGTATYQWFSVSGSTNTAITGATAANFTPPVLNTPGTYDYMVQVTLSGNGCGQVQSTNAQITVVPDPTVSNPVGASYCLNSSTALTLSVSANGGVSSPYNYQWFATNVNNNTSGNAIAGATSNAYIPPATTIGTVYYYCVVSQGVGCSVSSAPAGIVISPAPSISTQPMATQNVCVGGTLTALTVAYADGSGVPAYQWYSNSVNSTIGGVAISGATGTSYTPSTALAGTTYFYCVITFSQSGCSSITSNISQVIISPDPVISTQPLNTQTICSGGSIPAALTVTYQNGTGNVSYQWYSVTGSTNSPITGATSASYQPPVFNAAGTFNYVVQVSLSGSGCGMVQSNNAQVIVLPDPTVSAPVSATYCNGYAPVQPLSVTANGGLSAAYTYQWYSSAVNSNSSGTLINGATAATYTPPVTTNGSVYYYCVVSQGAANTGCSIASATALIITSPAPAISTQPTSMQTACVGGTLNNLIVGYTGASTTPSYQWYSNAVNANTGGTPIPGATSSSYLPQNTTAGTVYYYCVISFPAISCTTISSNPGGVTIHPDPIISVQPITNQAICFGTTLSAPLNISYTGGYGTPSYQWNLVNGSSSSAIQNATNATYLPGNFNLAGTYSFNVTLTLSGNGCNVQTSNLAQVIVMPVPIVDSVASYLYCNADTADMVVFSGPITGTTYVWTNDNPGIGLDSIGYGNIMPFEVTNMNNFGIVGNIEVTPQLTTLNTTCSGAPVAFQIMVNPYQDVQDPQDLVLCHGTGVNGVQFYGSALINNWTNDLPALGIASSGSGTLPAFLATNNGTQPIVAHLSVTPSFNAVTTCPGDIETFTITILPNPNVAVTPAVQTVCSGDLTATVNMSGTATSYTWTNNQTSIGLAASGAGNIPAFLTNATGSNTTSTIVVTPIYTYSGVSCPGPSQNVQITVVPTPSVLPLQDLVYCNGDATNLIQILGNANELNWSSSNPSIGTAAIGTGSIASFNVNNPSQNPVSTVITVTPVNFFAGLTCMAPAEDFSITVNPTPTINPIADQVLCAQSNSPALLFSGNANSFIWSNSNNAIGLSSSGTGNISSFVTQNTLPSVITANVSVTPQFNNAGLTCQGAPELFTIDVLPVPTVGAINPQVLCNGTATAPITFTGNATSYSWINNNVSIGLAAAGTGNISGFNAVAGATNNVSNLVVTPSYAYNNTTCVGAPATTTITVLPSPFINTVQDVVACNGDLSGILAFSGTANTFNWTNSNPSIGLAASGSGNLPVFTNTNTSSNPLLATITVIPQTGQGNQTCQGTPEIFTITVNPTPSMLPPGSQALCSQSQTQPVNFSGNASSYSWLNSNTSIGLPSFGNGAIPAFNAQNNGLSTQIAQIQVTPQYVNAGTTCLGTPQNFTFSVDPIPTVQYSQISQAVCTGSSTTAVNLSSQTPGVTYSWNILNPSGAITGVPSMNGTGSLPSMTLVNSSNSSAQFNFQGMAISPLAGCVGYGPLGTISVDPAPVMQPLNDLTICSNALINYNLAASLPSTFSWTASANTNVVGQPTNAVNSNLIYNTLQNNASTLQYVTYTVTPTSFPAGCVGQPETFVAEVVPNIQITSVANYEICSGEPTAITLVSNLPGTFTYSATNNPNVQGESSNAQTGFYINDILSNNTAYDQIVSYNVQVVSNPYGCFGLPQVVNVEVHPEISITNASPTQMCSGAPLNLALTATENATFSWYATQNGLITGESTSAQNTNVLNDNLSLAPGVNTHQVVNYTISATSNVTGCDAQSLPLSIIVNPVPVVSALPDQLHCAGAATDPLNWTLNGTATNYAWTNSTSAIGLALNGNGNIPAFNVTNPGPQTLVSTITVTPQYINNGFNCAGTIDTLTITVEPIPSISYNIPNQDLCSGETSQLVAISSPTNGVNITWEIINPPLTISGIPNLTGSNNIPQMTLSNSSTSPQQILFQGTVSTPLNGCQTQGPLGQIVVLPEPVISNINDVTLCSNDVLSVAINSSIPATFSWGAQNNPNVNGESVGPIYSNFIYNTLLNTSSTIQYVNYTITPTSVNGGCVGVDQDFTVEVIPDIILDTNFTNLYDSICSGDLTNVLLQTNYPANIVWYALNNPNVSGETTTATAGNYISDILVNNTAFNQYVTYYVSMVSSPNACQGIPQTVTIKVFPNIQLTNATNINLCSNEQVDLNLAATVNATFTWYATNNGVVQGETTTPQNTSLINDILVNSSALTEQVNYAVDVVALNSGCQAFDLPITVNVLPLPVLLTNDTIICSGEFTNVNLVTNIPSSIVWNGVFNIPILGETYANISGNYINDQLVNNSGQDDTLVYEVLATSNGCTAPLDSVLVLVHDQPDVDFSVLTNPLCSEDTIQFTNLSNPNFDFDWSFGDGATSVVYSPIHIYNNSGVYEVMLVGTNPLNNCSAADSATIVVNKMPDASFYTMDTIGCGNLNATFYANYQASSQMVWDFGDGQTLAQVGNVTNYYEQAGCYDVTLTVTSPQGCVAQESYNDYVCVYENPIAFIGASPTSVNALNPTVQFSNSSQHAISYIWQMGDGGISYDDNPTYTYPMEGADYHVTMTAFNEVGCFDTTSIAIHVFEELIFYVPNTFTPNDDEKNQTFYPVLSQGMKRTYMEFYIYNRWGELVFESHDPAYGWDGTYGPGALDCPIGTYTWKLKLETLQTQEILDFHGHVNLIR